jgi:Zn-dependent M32 family carboxypeptidase
VTDAFSNDLDHLLHLARERIARLDNATSHVDALTDRYEQLTVAIERASACQEQLKFRLREMLEPVPHVAAAEYDRRRVA